MACRPFHELRQPFQFARKTVPLSCSRAISQHSSIADAYLPTDIPIAPGLLATGGARNAEASPEDWYFGVLSDRQESARKPTGGSRLLLHVGSVKTPNLVEKVTVGCDLVIAHVARRIHFVEKFLCALDLCLFNSAQLHRVHRSLRFGNEKDMLHEAATEGNRPVRCLPSWHTYHEKLQIA